VGLAVAGLPGRIPRAGQILSKTCRNRYKVKGTVPIRPMAHHGQPSRWTQGLSKAGPLRRGQSVAAIRVPSPARPVARRALSGTPDSPSGDSRVGILG